MTDLTIVGIGLGAIAGVIWIKKEHNDMHKEPRLSIPASYTGKRARPVFGQRPPMPTMPATGLGVPFWLALTGCAAGAFLTVFLLLTGLS